MLASFTYVAAAESKPVELECFLIKVEALEVEEQIAAKFHEENPNVTINFVATPDAETALFARIAANDIPDIMNTYPAETVYQKMMDDGLFVDLTGNAMFDNVPDSVLKMSAYKGKQYALPLAMSSYGVFYNKDIFAKHNLTPSTDYQGFLDLCQKLKDAGEQPLEFYDKSAGGVGQMAERLTGILNNDSNALFQRVAKGETDLTKEPEIRTLGETLLKIREFGQKDQLGTDLDQVVADFISGRTAMFVGGTWNVATILKANKDLNFAMFPFPNPMGTGESLPVNIDTSYSVYTGAKDVDAAVAFVAFHARPEIAQMYADVEGSPNVIKGVTYHIEQLMPINDTIMKGAMFLTPVNFWPAGMRSSWEQYLQQLFIDKDVDAFVKATQDMVLEFYNA
jgi:raffinose/stachyose/melibiose transport system substrate-binding protein